MSVEYGFASERTDTAALRALWQECFGDGPEVTDAFFEHLYSPDRTVLAEENGRLLGCGYLLRDNRLLAPGAEPREAAYLYALAVREDCRGRGMGRNLTEFCAREMKRQGCDLCLMPGSEGLREWYAAACGLKPFGGLRREDSAAGGEPGVVLQPVSLQEYMILREMLLKERPHAVLSGRYLRFQEALCMMTGGGFFRLLDENGTEGAACVELEDGCAYACELLFPGNTRAAESAVASAFGKAHCRALLPGTGAGLLTAGENCPDLWWGPVLD